MSSRCQASLRRSRIRPKISGPLHAPRRHIQSATGFPFRRQSYVPVERPQGWQQAQTHDLDSRRVLAAIFVAHTSSWIRPYSLLRLYGEPAACGPFADLQKPACSRLSATADTGDHPNRLTTHLVVSPVRRPYGCHPEAHARANILGGSKAEQTC
jgi:hypothetical protein